VTICRTSIVITSALVVTLGGCEGCDRSNQQTFRDLLSEPDSVALEKAIRVCKDLSPEAEVEIRSALTDSSSSRKDRQRWLAALLEADTNRYLKLALESTRSVSEAYWLQNTLESKLDLTSRAIVHEIIETGSGDSRNAAIIVLCIIADDDESLRFAEQSIQNTEETNETKQAALNLLGNAAFYNRDESAIRVIRPLLSHKNSELFGVALATLVSIPGEDALSSLQSLAHDDDGKISNYCTTLLVERKTVQATLGTSRAPGWKK